MQYETVHNRFCNNHKQGNPGNICAFPYCELCNVHATSIEKHNKWDNIHEYNEKVKSDYLNK